ncbi:MAG: hypothetical protein HFG48_03355 [Bacilli bacterium]|nr:hypothetical protein [Bacilli bacterium]
MNNGTENLGLLDKQLEKQRNKKIMIIEKTQLCPHCNMKGTLKYNKRLNKYTFLCENCKKYTEYRSLL